MEINGEKQFDKLIENGKKYLVDFYADWCGPCKMMGRIMGKLSDSELNGFKILKVNVDENQTLSMRHKIRSIPAVFLYKESKIVDNFVGVRDRKDLIDILCKY